MSEQDSATPIEPGVPEPSWQRIDLATDGEAGYAAAVEALAQGRLVVLPTDTVYGIAADALQADAVQGLLDAKQRGRDMPPPVLIAEPAMLRALAASVSAEVNEVAKRFWPGALTLIMKAQGSLRMDLGRTEGTIAVRVPDHEQTRELLRRTGPLAVSSANISGEPPATSIDEAIAQLGDSVAVYLDGGPTPGPVASTIVELSQTPGGRIIRQGVIGFAELAEVLPDLVDLPAEPAEPEPAEPEPAAAEPEPAAEPESQPAPTEAEPTEPASADETTNA